MNTGDKYLFMCLPGHERQREVWSSKTEADVRKWLSLKEKICEIVGHKLSSGFIQLVRDERSINIICIRCRYKLPFEDLAGIFDFS